MSSSKPIFSSLYYIRRGIGDLWFLISLIAAIFLFAILLDYNNNDPGWSTSGIQTQPVKHWLGVFGAHLADMLFSLLGYAAYLIPISIIAMSWQNIRNDRFEIELLVWNLLFILFATISLSGIFALHWETLINSLAVTGGGLVGQKISIELLKIFSISTIMSIYSFLFIVSISLLFQINWFAILEIIGEKAIAAFLKIYDILHENDNFQVLKNKIKNQRRHNNYDDNYDNDDDDYQYDDCDNNTDDQYYSAPNQQNNINHSGRKQPQIGISNKEKPTHKFKNNKQKNVKNNSQFYKNNYEDNYENNYENNYNDNYNDDCDDNYENNNRKYDDDEVTPAPQNQYLTPQQLKKLNELNELNELHALREAEKTPQNQYLTPQQLEKLNELNELNELHAFQEVEQLQEIQDDEQIQALQALQEIEQLQASDFDCLAQTPLTDDATTELFAKDDGVLVKNRTSDNASPHASKLKVRLQTQPFHDIARPAPRSDYKLPSLQLLDKVIPQQTDYSEEELDDMAMRIESSLRDYKLEARVVNIELGPVVIRLQLELAAGVKVNQVINLDKDLARSLAVKSVRVVDVIPDKPYIGLEIPSRKRQTVYLRNMLESSAYLREKSPLTMVLGADITGNAVVVNLGKMPHLLVAGTTGSGKSVGVNVMLASMLYKAHPQELKMILIDPKTIEMSMYDGIAHLLTPVVTDMNEAENSLRWAVAEMERRYLLMSTLKVRSIDAYNKMIDDNANRGTILSDPLYDASANPGLANQAPALQKFPYIVIVIDELADMMMAVGKKVEELIARIAQKARAAGIHLILATQRPSVDVITGLIKANIPTRISFQVSSKIDSRTIIERQGAETLLGHGDMLFVPPGTSTPLRVHGAFISDEEVDRLTSYVKSQGEPHYESAITNPVPSEFLGAFGAAEKSDDPECDEHYDRAVALVIENNKASISWLQRMLNIGYNRSARIIEAMERAGIISAPRRGVRKVLVNQNDLD